MEKIYESYFKYLVSLGLNTRTFNEDEALKYEQLGKKYLPLNDITINTLLCEANQIQIQLAENYQTGNGENILGDFVVRNILLANGVSHLNSYTFYILDYNDYLKGDSTYIDYKQIPNSIKMVFIGRKGMKKELFNVPSSAFEIININVINPRNQGKLIAEILKRIPNAKTSETPNTHNKK